MKRTTTSVMVILVVLLSSIGTVFALSSDNSTTSTLVRPEFSLRINDDVGDWWANSRVKLIDLGCS